MNADVATLIDQLDSADAGARSAAAQRLATLGEDAAAAAVALVRCCGDENESVREWAAAALEECGPPRPADGDALAALLRGTAADVAYWAATLLGRMGNAAAPCVTALNAAFEQRCEPAVRQRIVWALGEIGTAAGGTLPRIESIISTTDDPRLRRLAEQARDRIQG